MEEQWTKQAYSFQYKLILENVFNVFILCAFEEELSRYSSAGIGSDNAVDYVTELLLYIKTCGILALFLLHQITRSEYKRAHSVFIIRLRAPVVH
jgi:hypothetical protein